jgi:transposase
LELLDRVDPSVEELTTAVEQEVKKCPEALRLMTHPGVGPITALAYVLIIGTPERFARGKQIGTYVGDAQKIEGATKNLKKDLTGAGILRDAWQTT